MPHEDPQTIFQQFEREPLTRFPHPSPTDPAARARLTELDFDLAEAHAAVVAAAEQHAALDQLERDAHRRERANALARLAALLDQLDSDYAATGTDVGALEGQLEAAIGR